MKHNKPKKFHEIADKLREAVLSADIEGVARYGTTPKINSLLIDLQILCRAYFPLKSCSRCGK